METSYEIISADLVQVKISITATRQQWNQLRLDLPSTPASCTMLKNAIAQMLSANTITVGDIK